MKIKTFVPQRLPLKKLKWESIIPFLGEAHQTLAEFNDILKTVAKPLSVFFLLGVDEAKTSVYSNQMQATFEMILCPEVFAKDHQKIQSILNYHRGLLYAMKARVEKKTFSNDLLLHIHGFVKNNAMNKADVGHFRNRQNWIGPEGCSIEKGRFFPPRAALVPAYMRNLRAYLNYPEKDELVQLAIYFAQLLIIHPFMDGNGRVGRILIPLFLCQRKLISHPLFYLSGYFKKHNEQYFTNLLNLSDNRDWEGWIVFFLRGIIDEGKRNCQKAKNLSELYIKLARELSQILSPKLAEKSLEFLFKNPIFERRDFAACSRISLATQKRVFKALKIREHQEKMVCQTILSAL